MKIKYLVFLLILLILPALAGCGARSMPETSPSTQTNPPAMQQTVSPSPAATIPAETAKTTQDTGGNIIQSTENTAVIAFTFDDGYVSDYKIVYPILKKYGIKGTSYIVPYFIEKKSVNRLTWDEINEMKSYGWVFGCHTYNHKDLKTMSAEKIAQSMQAVDKAFMDHGLNPPVVGAYPYGSYSQKTISALKQYRKQERKAFYQKKFVNLNNVKPYEIDSVSADVQSKGQVRSLEKLVDNACKQKTVIVFRAHSMFKEKKNDTGRFLIQTDSRLFEELVAYCVKKGCRFVTMEELMDMYT